MSGVRPTDRPWLPAPPGFNDNEILELFEVSRGQVVPKHRKIDHMKVALVTPWNIPCGISTYAEMLADALKNKVDLYILPEGDHWKRGEPLTKLVQAIKHLDPDVVHVQHEYGLFPDARHWLAFLSQLIEYRVLVTLHSVYRHEDKTICEAACPNVIVHSPGARQVLLDKGINRPIEVIPHGCRHEPNNQKLWNLYRSSHTVMQFGFGFRYKGWEQSLAIIAELKKTTPDVFFTGIFSTTTIDHGMRLYMGELQDLAKKLGIEENIALIPGFMSEVALSSYLRTSAVGLFPYVSHQDHECWGASGAARLAMAHCLPIVGSAMHHFDDLEGVVPRPRTIEDAAGEIKKLWEDPSAQLKRQNEYLKANSWDAVADLHIRAYSPR